MPMAAIAASPLVVLPYGLQHHPQLTTHHHHHHKFMVSPPPPLIVSRKCSSNSFTAYSLSSDSSWEREEARWLREEKRWLREEARWLKEEARWNAEREALRAQISSLREELINLQQQQETNVLKDASPASLTKLSSMMSQLLLQSMKGVEFDAASSSLPAQISVRSSSDFHTSVRAANSLESSILEGKSAQNPELSVDLEDSKERASSDNQAMKDILTPDPKNKKKMKRRTLKRGSEGEDVKEMQEALQRLGFYSGEEDMEYSSYAGDTVSAVKSWQATIGTLEDGMMTEELLAKLLGDKMPGTSIGKGFTNSASVPSSEKEGINGLAHKPFVAKVAEVQQAIKTDPEGVEISSERRVYLLGENRWEEPQRLADQRPGTQVSKCFSCRGEGKTLCTECEGTGDLNVEEQFLEWVEEGAGCPYCEGSGYLVCDECKGKGEKF